MFSILRVCVSSMSYRRAWAQSTHLLVPAEAVENGVDPTAPIPCARQEAESLALDRLRGRRQGTPHMGYPASDGSPVHYDMIRRQDDNAIERPVVKFVVEVLLEIHCNVCDIVVGKRQASSYDSCSADQCRQKCSSSNMRWWMLFGLWLGFGMW